MMRDSSVLRIVDNDIVLTEEPRIIKVWDKERKIWGGYRKIMAPNCVHFYKSFYGMVDVHNGLRARYGLDWQTRRKMFRVQTSLLEHKVFVEYGVSHIDSYGFINAYVIVRENVGLQGGNVHQKKYSYRYMLLDQARDWARRCMVNGFTRKTRVRSKDRATRLVTQYFPQKLFN